jgi:N-methylhydantoinase B
MAANGNQAELAPILFEIIEGALESARREMEAIVDRTARSTIVREQHDHRAGIFNAAGQSVTALSFASTPTPIISRFSDRTYEGDIFIFNDVYKSDGGITHLPDICITVPVFHEGSVVGWIQVFGNVNDIGGLTPGSVPLAATEVFQEGLIIPPVKLYDRGVRNEALYETILNNSRFPDDLQGDIDAFINACKIGAQRVEEVIARYGRTTVEETWQMLLNRCARDLRDVVFPMIPDGTYEFEDFCEYEDVQPLEPRRFIRLRAKLIKTPDKVVFDFTGTDEQVIGSLNWPGNESYYAKSLSTLFKAFAPDMVVNDGVNQVIECVVPKGTVLNPHYPAACSWRTFPLLRILDIGLGLIGRAVGGFIPASQESISSYGFFGTDEHGESFLLREITGAGSGARPFADGADTVDVAPESKNMPGEFAETFYPVRIERLGLRTDSGGAGLFRGGTGYCKDIRVLVDGMMMIHSDRARLQPWGVSGGQAGLGSVWILNPGEADERILPGKSDGIAFKAGDVLRVLSPGGGGWGDPLERDPAAVCEDVKRDLVSVESASNTYGVIFNKTDDLYTLSVDEAASVKRREEIRAERPELLMYDRGDNVRALIAAGDLTLTTSDARDV